MPNLLYITNVHEDENDGIWNKIKYNLYAYQRLGYNIFFSYRKENYYILDKNFNTQESDKEIINCIHKDLYYYNLSEKIKENNYDIVYLRKPIGGFNSIFLPTLLSKLKKNNKTKVVLEIPTYPYKKEIKTKKLIISEIIFKISRQFFSNDIDLIVYMGEETNNIWGRPSLRIANAIDLEHVKIVKDRISRINDEVVFVGVARLAFWHGYDRLIKAISKYKGRYKINFLVVGDSEPEMGRLKQLMTELGVEDKVSFMGAKSGNDLNELYKISHICVDSLGRHRSGSLYNSSLKSKEYAAKGLPFIKSHIDDSFNNENFVFNVSSDENDLDIDSIINWYQQLPDDTPVKMRLFAEDNLSWDNQCQKVLDVLTK